MADPACTCPCSQHRIRAAFYKMIDGFTNRKASMTLVTFGMVVLMCLIAGKFKALEANLPTVLGAIVGALTVFITGHAVDQKWTPSAPEPIEKEDLPKVAKVIAKDVVKEEQEEGS